MTDLQSAGFPHSDIHGSKVACTSPWLIAACHVLPRLSAPRHPPCALTTLGWCPKEELSLPQFPPDQTSGTHTIGISTYLALDSAATRRTKQRVASRSFQTQIFKNRSLCPTVLFHSCRAAKDNKIRVFVNSESVRTRVETGSLRCPVSTPRLGKSASLLTGRQKRGSRGPRRDVDISLSTL